MKVESSRGSNRNEVLSWLAVSILCSSAFVIPALATGSYCIPMIDDNLLTAPTRVAQIVIIIALYVVCRRVRQDLIPNLILMTHFSLLTTHLFMAWGHEEHMKVQLALVLVFHAFLETPYLMLDVMIPVNVAYMLRTPDWFYVGIPAEVVILLKWILCHSHNFARRSKRMAKDTHIGADTNKISLVEGDFTLHFKLRGDLNSAHMYKFIEDRLFVQWNINDEEISVYDSEYQNVENKGLKMVGFEKYDDRSSEPLQPEFIPSQSTLLHPEFLNTEGVLDWM